MQLAAVLITFLAFFASQGRATCPYAASATTSWSSDHSTSLLSSKFYKHTCPDFERIVKRIVANDTLYEAQMPAHLIRLLWHDCAVQGCDASVMLKSIEGVPSEREAEGNALFGLMKGGYDTVNKIKAALEASCPRQVSCADIIVATAKYGLIQAHGPKITMRYGRRDGPTSIKAEPDIILPLETFTPSQSRQMFRRLGLSAADMVALIGTHTVGTANCWKFYPGRLGATLDPRYAPEYAQWLNATCIPPSPGSKGRWAWLPLDNVTSTRFDNQYFKNVLNGYGLLNTDAGLLERPDTKKLVVKFAKSQAAFFAQYTKSVQKLSEIGVLTGDQGEIRLHCESVLPQEV